jgi:NADPH:quinone reductase-like Zn-dependent oxidoreductase
MKAAVLSNLGAIPVYSDFPDPIVKNENQVLINVKAASIKNLDKIKASGKHYTNFSEFPVVVGFDGVGVLEDGTKIYAQGITGMIGEKAVIAKNKYILLPNNLDYITAAALPNAVLGEAMPLFHRAKMLKGEVVLINGATGVTGQIAVQIAKYFGASKIIVTGRNPILLKKLKSYGADQTISLEQTDEVIVYQLAEINNQFPIDIVIDYLWGHPLELIIQALKQITIKRLRIVTVGEMAGSTINLSSGTLRSFPIEILGSGIGSLSMEEMEIFNKELLPEMFKLASQGIITINTQTEKLENIEKAWGKKVEAGKRLVITM